VLKRAAVCCGVLQFAPVCAVCCSVQQTAAVCYSVLQCAAVFYSVLQCVTVCFNVLQCAAVYQRMSSAFFLHVRSRLNNDLSCKYIEGPLRCDASVLQCVAVSLANFLDSIMIYPEGRSKGLFDVMQVRAAIGVCACVLREWLWYVCVASVVH